MFYRYVLIRIKVKLPSWYWESFSGKMGENILRFMRRRFRYVRQKETCVGGEAFIMVSIGKRELKKKNSKTQVKSRKT